MAVLSTGQSSLGGFLRLGAFNLDDVSTVVTAAGTTDGVRQLGAMTLRAFDDHRWDYAEVGAPLALTRFGVFSLG